MLQSRELSINKLKETNPMKKITSAIINIYHKIYMNKMDNEDITKIYNILKN